MINTHFLCLKTNSEAVGSVRNRRISILLPSLRGGGAEKVAVNLANSFTQRGFLVDMVLMSATGEFLHDLNPNVNVINLKIDRVRRIFIPLIGYIRQARPEAFLACMWPLTAAAVVARILSRVATRVIVAEHTTWSQNDLVKRPSVRWQVRTSMRLLFPSANGIVAVSQGAANDLAHFARLDIKKITMIYNPVVGEAKPRLRAPLAPLGWLTGSHYKLLAVGTLKEIKDYGTLLKAFALLCQSVDARLLILGEGECRLALEAQVRQLGIEDRVYMPGFVKDPSPYYHQANLHVLSSKGEGLPTVLIEALAAGTPVVSTDCPSGPREILGDDKFGLLVPVGDATALALAMEESLVATHDISALKARAQDFSIVSATDRYLELLFPQTAIGTRS